MEVLEAIVSRARAGDRDALDELLVRWTGAVYGRALRALDSPEAAEDACQEILLLAARRLPTLRDPARFAAWLHRLTDRACARLRRREPATEPLADEPGAVPGPEGEVLERLEAERLRALIRAALATLPPRSRLAVELFYFHELSCREVAEFLGSTPGATKLLLHEARQELRMSLQNDGGAVAEPVPVLTSYCAGGQPVCDHPFGDLTAPPARLYAGLYPGRSLVDGRRRAGLEAATAESALAKLTAGHYVELVNGTLVCRAPVLLATDWLLLKPWVQRSIAAAWPVVEVLRAAAEEVVATVADAEARAMVRCLVVVVEGVRQVLDRVLAAQHEGYAHRGPAGRFNLWFRTSLPPDAARGWRHSSSGSLHDRLTLVVTPEGMDTRARDRLVDGSFADDHGPRHRLLWSLAEQALTPARLAEVAAEQGWAVDAFAAALLDAKLIRPTAAGYESGFPVLPVAPWHCLWARFDGLGAELGERLADVLPELRERIAHASFREANVIDAVWLALTLLKAGLDDRLRPEGLAPDPATLPPNWGIVLGR